MLRGLVRLCMRRSGHAQQGAEQDAVSSRKKLDSAIRRRMAILLRWIGERN